LIGGISTEGMLATFNFEIMPLTTTLVTIMAIIIAYTIRKYRLMIPLEYELKSIKEEYKKLFVTFNALPDSIVLITKEGRILETNSAMDRNFGNAEGSLTGENLYDLLPKKVVKGRRNLVHKTLLTGSTQENEDKIKGRYFHNLFIPTESIGVENNLLMISKDITDQRKAEKERKQLEKQMQQSQKLRSLGTMAGGIAHDFKNILTPILGFSNMALKKMDPSSTSYIYIEEINNAAQRAKEIIDQILRFSRESETKKQPVDLQEIIEEALKLLQSFIPATIEIKKYIKTSCGKVWADSTQIHEVITNLCTNAVHAMEDKGGILEIKMKQVDIDKDHIRKSLDLREQEYVQITITDTGIGMTKEIRERIFDPFFTTKEIDKGTGLGLSVVHGIIKDHQGAITVSSIKGKGSVFTLYLPVFQKAL
ncbi:MAG: ATP-binding protein, partial [bacterium]